MKEGTLLQTLKEFKELFLKNTLKTIKCQKIKIDLQRNF